ncbi:MAG: ABC transporter permease [Verrucomicrobia bacterium]|nr:ABC transporter permease [Verrucomicrobiota bacterium]
MAVPLKYNFRNLRVRWRLTLATMLGIALVVAVFVMIMALARGLKATYVSTGDPRNLLVLRKGSTAESSSQITRNEVRLIKYLDGIARDTDGEPLASAEILVLINLDRLDRTGTANVLVRGIGPVGLRLRTNIRLVEGRMFRPGLHECVVSRKIANRFANCRVGEQFRSGRTLWRVVGIFEAAKTAYESEIWVDADEARDVFKRNFYGSILIRPVEDTAAVATMIKRMEADKQLSIRVLPETEYYLEQTKTAAPIQWLGGVLAVVMSIGAAFSAMNTMYAAVSARTREIGTLRVLGFRRRHIYVSFLLESVILALLGGAVGCLFSLPLNGMATGTMSWTTFSEVAFEFRITPELLMKGMAFALVMGVLGGLLPARLAARKPVLDALRSA